MQDVAEDGSGLVEGEVPDEHVRIVRDPVLEEVALGDRGETKLLVELSGETGSISTAWTGLPRLRSGRVNAPSPGRSQDRSARVADQVDDASDRLAVGEVVLAVLVTAVAVGGHCFAPLFVAEPGMA